MPSFASRYEIHKNQTTLVVVSNKCYEHAKLSQIDSAIHTAISSQSDKNFRIKKFYLNCHNDCSEAELTSRFDLIWKKILKINPDYLIVTDNMFWDEFKWEFSQFAKDPNKRIGVFNVYNNSEIRDDIDWLHTLNIKNIVVSTYTMNIFPVLNYFTKNAADYNNFIILRDSCAYNLQLAVEIRKQIKQNSVTNNVSIIEVYSKHDLKRLIVEFQGISQQSVIIPIMDNLSNNDGGYISVYDIFTIIKQHNKRHIELSLTYDASRYFGISYTYNLGHDIAEPDNNIKYFLTEFPATAITLLQEDTYLVVNRQELRRIFNGEKLLRITNDHVDKFR